MPAALPRKIRKAIIERRQAGDSFAAISRELEVYYGTVRNICDHYHQTGHLQPNYQACAQEGVRKDPAIYQRAIELKQLHPGWGAGLIWVELAEEFAENDLPCERSLQRWFHRAGLVEKQGKDLRPEGKIQRGKQVHEVWALDAKEQIQLANGDFASWVAMTDEASGAMLEARAFPPEEMESGASDDGEGMVRGGV